MIIWGSLPCGKLRHPSSAAWIPALSGGRLRPSPADPRRSAAEPVHREGADSWRPKIGLSYSIFCKKKVKKANSLRSCEFAFVRLEHKSKLSTFLRICFCIIHHGQMAYLFLRQLAHCRRKRLEKTWKMWKNAIFLMRIDADSSSFVNQTKPFFLRQFRLTTQNLLPSAIPHKRRDKNALPSIKINKKQ